MHSPAILMNKLTKEIIVDVLMTLQQKVPYIMSILPLHVDPHTLYKPVLASIVITYSRKTQVPPIDTMCPYYYTFH